MAEPEETGDTFEANARLKALHYAAAIPGLVVSEDSGLVVDAMDGQPGVRSARYLSPSATYPERFAAILRAPARPARHRAAPPGSSARWRWPRAPAVLFETRGVVEGHIADAPAGTGGFGYDPIFFSPELGCTLAEAGDAKAAVSHRGRAFAALIRWLDDLE